ncbi:unnamed protein product, partial [Staurois parvus]
GSWPAIPGDHQVKLTGERPTSCLVSLCTANRHKAACLPSKTQLTVKHTQHTVNPLITPDVNLFLPSVISTVSVLFISTDH